MRFARRQGARGVMLEQVAVQHSARDIEPIAKALSPSHRFQAEVAFLKGSRFKSESVYSVAGVPVIRASEVS